MQCVFMLVVMHSIAITHQGPAKVDVKSHIGNGIAISWIITCCVLLVMSPASNQIAEVRPNTPAPMVNFDMQWARERK